ncbi:MAG: hypothetical protein H0X51_08875 [Parachlamydiaceae bacterium]|nr:hypothetical protein [Parachlamydiaceae bacterium]
MHEYDQRQYKLMLDKILIFKEGKTSLGCIVDDLDGLLEVLEERDKNWRRALLRNSPHRFYSPLPKLY